MKIERKISYIPILSYIAIPILLFLFGWTKWYLAVPCAGIWLFCMWQMYRDIRKADEPPLKIHPAVLLICLLLTAAVGYYVGWGRWTWQPWIDWEKHNAVLEDLVNHSWPVYYYNDGEHSMLTYYIAQYLVPAVMGKLFHSFRVAEVTLYVWNVIGLFLVWLEMVRSLKVKGYIRQILCLVLIVFFSLPFRICSGVTDIFTDVPVYDINWYILNRDTGIILQYTSNYSMLLWVFPQAIVPWLTTLLFIENREKICYYIPLMMPMILYATLAFAGIVVLAVGYAVYVLVRDRNFKKWILQIFSGENLLTLATLSLMLLMYLYGNITLEKPATSGFALIHYGEQWYIYFIFIGTMVFPYALCLFRQYRKDVLYWMSVVILAGLPLIRMGFNNDLMMRGSIPATFILMYDIADFLNQKIVTKVPESAPDTAKKIPFSERIRSFHIDVSASATAIVLVGLLFVSGQISRNQLFDSIDKDDPKALADLSTWGSAENYANRSIQGVEEDRLYNYYTYDIEENFFYRFVARVQDVPRDIPANDEPENETDPEMVAGHNF